jgi:WD40 repeat protein
LGRLGDFYPYGRWVWFGVGDRAVAAATAQSAQTATVSLIGLYDHSIKRLTSLDSDTVGFSVSPDGRWLATGTDDRGRGFSVWDVRSGKPVKAWDCGWSEVAFSRDGRWLVSTTGRLGPHGAGCYSWRVGSWEMASHVSLNRSASAAGVLAVAPDSRLVAVTDTMTTIRLMRLDTFEQVATLTAPNTELISQLAFSHDSSRLAAAAGKTIPLWDLWALRQSLRELDLDWDEPDYPAPPAVAGPWKVELDQGALGK